LKVKRGVILLGVVLLATAVAAVARAVQYSDAAKPGVHLLGRDVGGDSRSQLEGFLRSWSAQPVTVRAGGHAYHVPRGWLVSLDAHATASRALAAGSPVALIVAERVDVQPVLGRAGNSGNVLSQIARAGHPAVPASVAVHGTDVTVASAQDGAALDRAALLARFAAGATTVDAPFHRLRPAISTAAAEAVATQARQALSGPVDVDYHGAHRGSLTPLQLARALSVVPQGHALALRWDGEAIARVLRPRLGTWIVRARNARFGVSGDAVHVIPSRPGHDLSAAQLAPAVARAAADDRVLEVELGERQPDLTTAKANALGITTKLVSYTTQMGVSSSNRIHNVHLMADFIDGTVIKPGQEFSFNDVVGPRTAERGFLEGQEIIGSLVLPSIGGGVCQTATTLFNDAFELGLPILERTNHNLYLAHYPIGRDATVAWGGPDFRFRNDLKHGLLIKASYTDQTLTFTVYGTPEGRRIVSHTGPQVNWTKPSMNYAVDPNAPRRSVKVVTGSGELGFDVTVTRQVYDASGKLLRHDTFRSHYIPDSPTTVYGPGRTPPGPYIVIPTTI
jgi:vancomycin resistance protein YoaR